MLSLEDGSPRWQRLLSQRSGRLNGEGYTGVYHEADGCRRKIVDPGRRRTDGPGARRAVAERADGALVDSFGDAPLDLCRRQTATARPGNAGRGNHRGRGAG